MSELWICWHEWHYICGNDYTYWTGLHCNQIPSVRDCCTADRHLPLCQHTTAFLTDKHEGFLEGLQGSIAEALKDQRHLPAECGGSRCAKPPSVPKASGPDLCPLQGTPSDPITQPLNIAINYCAEMIYLSACQYWRSESFHHKSQTSTVTPLPFIISDKPASGHQDRCIWPLQQVCGYFLECLCGQVGYHGNLVKWSHI